MVKDTRAETRPSPVRPLNIPRVIRVAEEPKDWPDAVSLRSMLKVASVEDRWRVDDEWWREHPVSRLYYECTLEDGRKVTVFKDLIAGRWYRQNG